LRETGEGKKNIFVPHQNFIIHGLTLDGWKMSIFLSRLLLNKQTF
jgi:hypothetical protein